MKKSAIFLSILLWSWTLAAAEWKVVLSENDIVVEAEQVEEGVIPFRATTTFNAPIEKVFAALKDLDNKSKWAPKLKSVKVHKQLSKTEYYFSEYYETPWPASDREFLLHGNIIQESKDRITLTGKSLPDESLMDSDHVIANVGALDVTLDRLGESKTKVVFNFRGDLGGWIPLWISNLIQKRWPYKFLLNLKDHIKSGA